MRKALLVLVLMMLGSFAFAALSDYTFQQSPATWTPLATPTVIHSTGIDDAMSTVIPIGFTFMYDEVAYNEFKANSNGFITLNPASTASLSNNLATQILILAGLWDDLKTDDTDSHVAYQLTGTAPNQVLTVEFKNLKWYYSITPVNLINFQIKLYQGSNKVEIVYGAMGATPGTSATASIGLSGAVAGNFMSITPASPTASYSSATEFNQINGTHVPFLTGQKYEFIAPIPANNDLAAQAIVGNVTPSVGAATNYTVTVFNRGANAQSTYQVQIIDASNVVLASVAGPTIAASTTQQVAVPWTPTQQGPVTLRGKVVLTGDENPANDISSAISIVVQPEGVMSVTIGAGDQSARLPVDMFYKASAYQTLYYPGEIGVFGNITSLTFYNNFTTNLPNMPTQVWLGTTQLEDLSAGWIPANEMTLVYDGNVNYPTGQNNIVIQLQTPFTYAGGNLVLLVKRPLDAVYYSSADNFYAQTVGTNRSRKLQNDSTDYDVNALTGGTLSGQFPKTTLSMTPLSPDPLFFVGPDEHNFGQVLLGHNAAQTFNVGNMGGGTLTVNSITISGNAAFTLENVSTLPATLSTGQTANFTVRYTPTTGGEQTATVTITDNLGRTTHTVPISGSGFDATITTLPYTQNWDSVTAPALPLGWSALVQSTTTAAYARTVTTSPQSTPNTSVLFNSTDIGGQVMLVAPQLATDIPANSTRIKAWVKGGGTGYNVQFGVMTDPTDPTTFVMVGEVSPTTAWLEYTIPLLSYTGTGRFIAIRHGHGGTSRTLYVDGITFEMVGANDLLAGALTGNSTPSVGAASNYTLNVINNGTAAQNAYTVKLMSSTGTELASAPGLPVAVGESVLVSMSWTPTDIGAMSIYGSIVLAGDINPGNNNSTPMNITVQPTGIISVPIGTGNLNEGVPWEFYYRNSLHQSLIYPNEIGMYGNITTVLFYNQFSSNLPNMPVKLWLGSTDLEDLSAGWISTNELTLVYDGTLNFPSGANTITVPLQTPYTYAGGNLVLYAYRPMDTQYYSSSDDFKAQTVGTNRARKLFSDSVTYDPDAPSAAGALSGTFPQLTLIMTPLSTDPMMSVNPANSNFGQILLGATATRNVTITNVGGGTLGINSITLSTSPHYSITNMPTLPASLTTGSQLVLNVLYNPTAAGTHTATITVVDDTGRTRTINVGARDNNAAQNRESITVNLTATAIDATITALPYSYGFDDVTAPALPIQWSRLVQSTSAALVRTYTTTPQGAPNTAGLTNSADLDATAILIAPPLSTEIPVNTVRLKFWGRAAGAGYPLQIGVMSNPASAASFTLMQTVDLTTTWTEYIVPLTGYTGTGRFIAFKHGLGGTYRTLYVDTVTMELVAPNDLGAMSIAGNTTPTVGIASTYVVTVQNWGTNAQNDYEVKLYDSSNNELASIAGPALTPGQTLPVNINWVPTQQGAVSIYGKVVLDGDANPGNDQTPNLNLAVNPAGVVTITVGDGGATARVPLDMYYRNSLFQTLYYPAEMGNFMGQITAISFYNQFTTNLPDMPTKVWIGTTTQANLADGWIPATQLTLAFDGTINYPSGQNTITIPFNNPFMYLNGENLVIMVNRPMDTTYYSSADVFVTQTVGTNRARNMYSDSTTYDPNAPTGGTASGIFPKTTFMVIPGGVGDILGNVTTNTGTPLQGVTVELVGAGYNTTTNAAGDYSLINILPGDYTISFSKYGYVSHTQNITLEEDDELTVNASLSPMAQVQVTGTIHASDTGSGINGATIRLMGYADYTTNSNATGQFAIPAVYANQSYNYSITAVGYQNVTGTVEVGATNHNMGTVTLAEVAYAPGNVAAEITTAGTAVEISWTAPDPNALSLVEGFEGAAFPPMDWTQSITNTGPANASGVYPTWSRFGSVTIGTTVVAPPTGSYQTGVWWAYEHQDEWLVTPSFYCPSNASLTFDGYVFLGSTAGDHYYVKASTDNGTTWDILWDASTQAGGWNYYATPINVDLSAYTGQNVKLAFHAVDPPSNDGLWYVWFIDNVTISNQETRISFNGGDLDRRSASQSNRFGTAATTHPSRAVENGYARSELSLPLPTATESTRALIGYKVWRLAAGQESNQANWALVTPETITALDAVDNGWTTIADGDYRWAVKAIYTSDVASNPVFTNTITKETITGMISGVVRQTNNQPIPGATVAAGDFTATTNNSGAYVLIVPIGSYSVTASATNYETVTQENIVVNANQTTTVNFVLDAGSSNDSDVIPVVATALNGNYPNPFNPSTTIRYSVKDPAAVRIEIYNLKGQRVSTLVDAEHGTGHYNVVWNGRDAAGRSVGSGIYFYRMQAGSFTSTRKMMLVE